MAVMTFDTLHMRNGIELEPRLATAIGVLRPGSNTANWTRPPTFRATRRAKRARSLRCETDRASLGAGVTVGVATADAVGAAVTDAGARVAWALCPCTSVSVPHAESASAAATSAPARGL